jgi:hypothetical protein
MLSAQQVSRMRNYLNTVRDQAYNDMTTADTDKDFEFANGRDCLAVSLLAMLAEFDADAR